MGIEGIVFKLTTVGPFREPIKLLLQTSSSVPDKACKGDALVLNNSKLSAKVISVVGKVVRSVGLSKETLSLTLNAKIRCTGVIRRPIKGIELHNNISLRW
jgi:hypothetical protein